MYTNLNLPTHALEIGCTGRVQGFLREFRVYVLYDIKRTGEDTYSLASGMAHQMHPAREGLSREDVLARVDGVNLRDVKTLLGL